MIDILLPQSKSIFARMAMAAAYSGAALPPVYPDDCDDVRDIVSALRDSTMGMPALRLGSSGTALRLMLPYLCLRTAIPVTLTGTRQLATRPVAPLVKALRTLGADIQYTGEEGFIPLRIGPSRMHGGDVTVDASGSSQYVSALMLLAPALDGGLDIHLPCGSASRPYVAMTAEVLRRAGAQVDIGDSTVSVHGSYLHEPAVPVERDWSAAAPFYQALALCGNCEGIFFPALGDPADSLQGDAAVAQIFSSLGVTTVPAPDGIRIFRSDIIPPEKFVIDMNAVPDLVPAVSFTLCRLGIPFTITSIGHLRIKESDRIASIIEESGKQGYSVSTDGNSLYGNGLTTHCNVAGADAHGDHRIAMAIAALDPQSSAHNIRGAECVSKSFPSFFEQIEKLKP